ncbi:amidohydrolase family protein, partial [Lysobacter sp. A3-1-A15]
QAHKGILAVGQFADFSLLSADYFAVDDEAIQDITSVLTVVGGKVVHGDGEYSRLAPALPVPTPDWSPVRHFGGYQGATLAQASAAFAATHTHGTGCSVHGHGHAAHRDAPTSDYQGFWGTLGCSCFAF